MPPYLAFWMWTLGNQKFKIILSYKEFEAMFQKKYKIKRKQKSKCSKLVSHDNGFYLLYLC